MKEDYKCFLCSKDPDLKWNMDSLKLIRELKLCTKHSEIVESHIKRQEEKDEKRQQQASGSGFIERSQTSL